MIDRSFLKLSLVKTIELIRTIESIHDIYSWATSCKAIDCSLGVLWIRIHIHVFAGIGKLSSPVLADGLCIDASDAMIPDHDD